MTLSSKITLTFVSLFAITAVTLGILAIQAETVDKVSSLDSEIATVEDRLRAIEDNTTEIERLRADLDTLQIQVRGIVAAHQVEYDLMASNERQLETIKQQHVSLIMMIHSLQDRVDALSKQISDIQNSSAKAQLDSNPSTGSD